MSYWTEIFVSDRAKRQVAKANTRFSSEHGEEFELAQPRIVRAKFARSVCFIFCSQIIVVQFTPANIV